MLDPVEGDPANSDHTLTAFGTCLPVEIESQAVYRPRVMLGGLNGRDGGKEEELQKV